MPLPRFDNLDPVQRDTLLAAATREFAERGYADASLNQILKDAGLSKGSLYYYFADRDDLYAHVVLQTGIALREKIGFDVFDPQTKEEFEPALVNYARLAFELIQKEPEKFRALRSFQRDLRRHAKPAFEPLIALARATFVQIVQRGREFGLVRTDLPENVLIELLESVDEVFDRVLFEAPTLLTGDALERHLALVVDAFHRIADPRPITERPTAKTGRS